MVKRMACQQQVVFFPIARSKEKVHIHAMHTHTYTHEYATCRVKRRHYSNPVEGPKEVNFHTKRVDTNDVVRTDHLVQVGKKTRGSGGTAAPPPADTASLDVGVSMPSPNTYVRKVPAKRVVKALAQQCPKVIMKAAFQISPGQVVTGLSRRHPRYEQNMSYAHTVHTTYARIHA